MVRIHQDPPIILKRRRMQVHKNLCLCIRRCSLEQCASSLKIWKSKATEAAVFEGLRCSLEAQKGSFRVVIAFTNRFIEVLQEPT